MKNKIVKKCIFAIILALVTVGFVGITVIARSENRAANIKSKGIFDFKHGEAVFDASDLTYLADEIDLLEITYKTETVEALNQMGTFFTEDKETTHDTDETSILPESADVLSFSDLRDGILNSQSIPTERSYNGTLPESNEEVTGNVSAAIADNLSLGKASWVEGNLFVGNGADNKTYYNKGYVDGFAAKQTSVVAIEYKYHTHVDDNSNDYTNGTILYTEEEPGGCFIGNGHVHNKTGTCPKHTGTKTCGGRYSQGDDDYTGETGTYAICGSCGKVKGIDYEGRTCKEQVSYTIWDCGSPTNKWILGCGKTTETIESALVVFE